MFEIYFTYVYEVIFSDDGTGYEISSVLFDYDPATDIEASIFAEDADTYPGGTVSGVIWDPLTASDGNPNAFWSVQDIYGTYEGTTFNDQSVLVSGDLYDTTWTFDSNGDYVDVTSSLSSTGDYLFSDSNYFIGDIIDFGEFDLDSPLVCFAEGTQIETPDGPRAVETLSDGDLVCTIDGPAVPVVWLGRQRVARDFMLPDRTMLIRITAGALGEGVPADDLTVTADHGLVIDGAIIHASALVNGLTVHPVPVSDLPPVFTVYHVETPDHAVILSNGCPSETFIDNVSRRRFDNYDLFRARFGDDPAPMTPLAMPRAKGPRQVPVAIRTRLSARAALHLGGARAVA